MGDCVTGRRAAELAAAGLSNKQVTEQLQGSVYTVEAHLSQAYAKPGIRSRTRLALALASRVRSAACRPGGQRPQVKRPVIRPRGPYVITPEKTYGS